MDKSLIHYHEHNLAEQILHILQIIRELKQIYDLYTDLEISEYYRKLKVHIEECCCIECKHYALMNFNIYLALWEGESMKIVEIFQTYYVYLLKT
jgi:hypothetical protein